MQKARCGMSLAGVIYDNTMSYLATVSKAERKKIGQFFTPAAIADYMANMPQYFGETVSILDPGAGSGILSAAIVAPPISLLKYRGGANQPAHTCMMYISVTLCVFVLTAKKIL